METKEKNKMIAEFMGAEYERKKHPFEDRYIETLIFKGHPGNWRVEKEIKCHETPEQLMYHTDWDWLMPVVEKIESGLYCHSFIIFNNRATIEFVNGNKETTVAVDEKDKIGAVYYAVLKYINEYNLNQLNQK